MMESSWVARVECWRKIFVPFQPDTRKFFFFSFSLMDELLSQWAADLMDLSSGLFWTLTLLCRWDGRRVFRQINIQAAALQALSEINRVAEEACPLDQEWISRFRILSSSIRTSTVSFSLSKPQRPCPRSDCAPPLSFFSLKQSVHRPISNFSLLISPLWMTQKDVIFL